MKNLCIKNKEIGKKMKTIGIFFTLCFFIAASAIPSTGEKDILLKVITPEIAWADSNIKTKIKQEFSRQKNIRLFFDENRSLHDPEFPQDFYNTDSLINYGKEIGRRYIMIVEITSERLEKRKSFHIPLIFHKYQAYGVIEGELRILDVDRGKLLTAEEIKVEKKGPRILQATMDDDINDPDIHLTAPQKIRFFNELEDQLVKYLKKKSRAYLGMR